jgi:hypothetical protein
MNQKTAKLIRKQVAATHGIEKTNPQFKKIVNLVKKEYTEAPSNKRAQFKKTGI